MMDEPLGLAVDAMRAVGIQATPGPDGRDGELLIEVGGVCRRLRIKVMATVMPTMWHERFDGLSSANEGQICLIVADRVVGPARDLLRAHSQSWLDLRGHLYLTGPGVLVDAPVPPVANRSSPARSPLRGKTALETACELLISPGRQHGVRDLARTLNRSPSSVSAAMSGLRDAHLVTARGEPVIPQLFWETAAAWKPTSTGVSALSALDDPAIASALKMGTNEPDGAGWALTDSVAAAAYGAPIGLRADHPPTFYLPDATTSRRAETLLGVSTSTAKRAATIKVAPVPQVCARRNPGATGRWPLAHPLFVALDLAEDQGRGMEILNDWYPRQGIDRVW